MAQDAPRRRRARPVADAPIDGLLAQDARIAKGWMLALLEDAPLQAAAGIVGEALTHEAPRLCAAALRALVDDRELERLGADGTLRSLPESIATMVGAAGPVDAARAVDALSAVLWTALREQLRAPAPELVTELAERLALVCALIRDAAIAGAGDGAARVPAPVHVDPAAVDGLAADRLAADGAPADGLDAAPQPPASGAGDRDPWARQPADGRPLWMGVLADEIRDAGRDGRPLSLLLAELEDADRVVASAPPHRAGAAFGDFVGAVRGVMRAPDVLVCEADARAWVIARRTARAAAHSLGARIAEAVGESAALSGAPLVASVGIAVLGEDGTSADELAEAAEEARFSASARGIEVSRRAPDRP